MRELIHINIGSCGNTIGLGYFGRICEEHGVLPDGTFRGDSDMQLEQIEACFTERKLGFSPRVLFADTDVQLLEKVMDNMFGNLYQNKIVCHNESIKVHNDLELHHMTENTLESIRKQLEECNCPQGFKLTHSMGGITGSELTS